MEPSEPEKAYHCPECGVRIVLRYRNTGTGSQAQISCPYCGYHSEEPVLEEMAIDVSGERAHEVERVAGSLLKSREVPSRREKHTHPWVSGSFYLFAVVVLLLAALAVARLLPITVVPIVRIFGLLAITFIGALQLRQDDRLKEAGFLKLMLHSLKCLPFIEAFGAVRSLENRSPVAAFV